MPDQYGNPTESERRNRAPDVVTPYNPTLADRATINGGIVARADAGKKAIAANRARGGRTFAGTNGEVMSDSAYQLVSNNGTRAVPTERDVLGGGKFGVRGWMNKHPVGVMAAFIAAAAGGAALAPAGAGAGASGGAGVVAPEAGGSVIGFGGAGTGGIPANLAADFAGTQVGGGAAGALAASGGIAGGAGTAGVVSSGTLGNVANISSAAQNLASIKGGGGKAPPASTGRQPQSGFGSPRLELVLSPRMRARMQRRPHDMNARIASRNAAMGVG